MSLSKIITKGKAKQNNKIEIKNKNQKEDQSLGCGTFGLCK
jgi:hypothetical protein